MGEVLQNYSRESRPGVVSGHASRQSGGYPKSVYLPEMLQVHHRGRFGVQQVLNLRTVVERVLERTYVSEYFVQRQLT